jgi:hypothetical protein
VYFVIWAQSHRNEQIKSESMIVCHKWHCVCLFSVGVSAFGFFFRVINKWHE